MEIGPDGVWADPFYRDQVYGRIQPSPAHSGTTDLINLMTDSGSTTTAHPIIPKSLRSGSWTGKLVMLTFLIGLLAAIAMARQAWLQNLTSPKGGGNAHLVTQPARRGPFLISLSVQGHVDSRRDPHVARQVEGGTTIISIVPEGTLVQEGDVVCELDSSTLREEEKQQQITVTQAEAAESRAREPRDPAHSERERHRCGRAQVGTGQAGPREVPEG